MSDNILKLVVNTNNNIRFIVSLPSELTVQKALPIILKKYKSVVSQNFGDHPELLNVNTISHLTKNSCFFAKEEILGHVLNNNDELEVTLLHRQKEAVDQKSNKPKDNSQENAVKPAEQQSKKQKMQAKKAQKAKQQEAKTKPQEAKQKQPEKKVEKQPKQAKKDVNVSSIASDLLNKFRQGDKPKQPEADPSKKKNIKVVAQDSSDS